MNEEPRNSEVSGKNASAIDLFIQAMDMEPEHGKKRFINTEPEALKELAERIYFDEQYNKSSEGLERPVKVLLTFLPGLGWLYKREYDEQPGTEEFRGADLVDLMRSFYREEDMYTNDGVNFRYYQEGIHYKHEIVDGMTKEEFLLIDEDY